MAATRVQVTLQPSVVEMLDKLAKSQGLTRSGLVSLLVTREWREDGHTFSELENPPE